MRGGDAVDPDIVDIEGRFGIRAKAKGRHRLRDDQLLDLLLVEVLVPTEPPPLIVVEAFALARPQVGLP